MGMKPRLEDGPVQFPNLVSQTKRVPETAPLSNSELSSCSKAETGPIADSKLSSQSRK